MALKKNVYKWSKHKDMTITMAQELQEVISRLPLQHLLAFREQLVAVEFSQSRLLSIPLSSIRYREVSSSPNNTLQLGF